MTPRPRSILTHTFMFVAMLLVVSVSTATHAAVTSQQAQEFARRIETSLRQGDAGVLANAIEMDRIIDRTLMGIALTPELRGRIEVSLTQQYRLADQITQITRQGGRYTLLRVYEVNEEPRIRFRIIGADGSLNYHDIWLSQRNDGSIGIYDIHIHVTGELFSQTLRRTLLPMIVSMHRQQGVQDRPADVEWAGNVEHVKQIAEMMGTGQLEQAYRVFSELPTSVQNQKLVLISGIISASHVGLAEANLLMERYVRLYPNDPTLDLIRLDVLFSSGQFEQALAAIERLDRQVGPDPYLQVLRAHAHMNRGDADAANQALQLAMQAEPSLEQAYWTAIDLALMRKHFDEVATLLDQTQQNLGVVIGDLSQNPRFTEFIQSPAYQRWLAGHQPKPAADKP